MAKEPNQRVLTKKHLARLERERIQQRYLMAGAIVVIVLVLGIIIYGALDQTVFKNLRPVAKVGNETVSTGEFQKQVKFQRYRLIDQLKSLTGDQMALQFFGSYIQQIAQQLSSPNTIGQQVLDSQVEDILIQNEAKKRGITVSDAEVDKAFEEAFGYFPNGTSTPTITATPFATETLNPTQVALLPPTSTPTATLPPTEAPTPTAGGPTLTPTVAATPTEAVTATPSGPEATASAATAAASGPTAVPTSAVTPTPYTKDLLQKNVATYAANVKSIGYTEADLRALIRRSLLREKVTEALTKDVPTTSEQVWARHILVATEDEAKQALERLNKGEKFADVAAAVSTDSSASQGGDLGWFTKGKMVKPFEDEAFKLKVGEISQPVKSDFGYHVIQVLGHEEKRPLDATQLNEAKQKAYTDWVTEAKKTANVQTYDTWTQIVPTEPTVPPEITSMLQQLGGSQNQGLPVQTVPDQQQQPQPAQP